MTIILPHRWLSRLSMAVTGYSEQEKIRQDQGEISHRLFWKGVCLRLLQVAGQQLYKTGDIKQWDVKLLLLDGGVIYK